MRQDTNISIYEANALIKPFYAILSGVRAGHILYAISTPTYGI